MPLYEYQCDACGQRFEVIQKFSDPPVEACGRCGKGPVHRLLSSPAIQFKGSGWYITDYAQKGKSDGAGGAASETKAETKTDAKAEPKAESKSEAKSDPKSDAKST
jgi:putative FmdB family regulatory protein